jgi:NlpC/P60 family
MIMRRAICLSCGVLLPAPLLVAQAAIPVSLVAHPALSAGSPLPVEMPGPFPSPPESVVRGALAYLGVPYVSGGESHEGLDCSGLIYRVFHDEAGLDLPRGVQALFKSGPPAASPLHIGDLLFFDTTEDPSPSAATHVGVYAGAGTFIHAASEGSHTGVIVSALNNPYYRDRFLGARRFVQWRAPVLSLTLTDTDRSLVQTSPFPSREELTIRVYNGMTGGGPLDLTVLKDGVRVREERIAPSAQRASEISLVPDPGQWTVRVTRIFRGRELQNVSFSVEE